ncbi:MAG: ATP-grasp domain-containing protein [Candidatus Omnitrophota bacterium]
MKKSLNVLLVFDSPYKVEKGYDFKEEFKDIDWNSEKNVYNALLENNHKVRLLGVHNDIVPLIEEIRENKPDVVFNLTEVFRGKSHLDKNVVWILEMLGIAHTGGSPSTLLVCNNKALSKKILSFHRIKVPNFYTFGFNRKVWLPKKLRVPLIVKPLGDEASRGISQASIVDNEDSLVERVKFIHDRIKLEAIVEEYIDGREMYVGVFGHKRVKVLPPIEMKFGNVPEDEPRVATYRAKWDDNYRKKWGIKNVGVGSISESLLSKINKTCIRAYKALNISSYVRFDIRIGSDNEVYILEINANPCLAKDDDFAHAATRADISYNRLVQKLLVSALKR